MNCRELRKFLYAFADGQLGVKDNCEVLDHLKMCVRCSAIVEEHQSVRRALKKQLDDAPIPVGLEPRVRKALATGRPVRRWQPVRLALSGKSLAMAAVVALAVLVGYGLAPKRSVAPIELAAADEPTDVVEVKLGEMTASMAVFKHHACCMLGGKHHHDELPRELGAVAPAIGKHFSNVISVLAPDLTSRGYTFESANFCGVLPDYHGAHLIYAGAGEADVNPRLSVFSVPRLDCLDKCAGAPWGEGAFRTYRVPSASGGAAHNLIAWHEDATSYVLVCSGDLCQRRLRSIAEDFRVAFARPVARQFLASLSLP